MGQKISGLLFKISGSDFEIRATNFFIAPGRGKRAENQFSFFGRGKRCFQAPVLHSGVAFFLEDFFAARCAVPAKGITFAADKHESG